MFTDWVRLERVWLFSFYGTIFLSKRVCSCYCPLQHYLQIKWVSTCATLPLPKGKIKYGGIPKKWKKLFTQSRKSEATLTTRFPVSDFLTKKERCYAGAFQKQASLIRELSMTLNSIVSLYSEKKTNTKVTWLPSITSDCCRLDDYVSLHYLLKHMAHLVQAVVWTAGLDDRLADSGLIPF